MGGSPAQTPGGCTCGAGMLRWVLYLSGFCVTVFVGWYLIGCWLLGEKPWDLWGEQRPTVYDGKEPFDEWEAWAKAMDWGRWAQRKEEDK